MTHVNTNIIRQRSPKTSVVQTKHSQAVRQEQSLQLVQIMLHASFGTLFYLREFLPLSCFGDSNLAGLAKSDGTLFYEDFVNEQYINTKSLRRGQPLKIIVRNKEEKADKILNLLENGIFDALQRNVLEAVQLTILARKAVPSEVLETYTFSFKYTSGFGDVNNRLASISLETTEECTAEMSTMQSARAGLEMIIRRLITLSTFLPRLPRDRYMEIHLFYTNNCADEYEPPGFLPTNNEPILYPIIDGWTREVQSCGSMDTGIHAAGLKISYLQYNNADIGSTDNEPKQIPEDIEYFNRANRTDDVGIEEFDTVKASSAQQKLQRNTPDHVSVERTSTQAHQDNITRNVLEKMVMPSTPNSDIIPTQYRQEPLHAIMAEEASLLCRPGIPRTKLLRLYDRKATSLNEGASKQGNKSRVSCPCGWNQVQGDMLQCTFCDTSQHPICYGFLQATDPCIPDIHVCYECLLEPNESDVLRSMSTMALLRQALRVIIEDGYPARIKDFSQMLHCNGQTVVQITDMLKKEGFIQATPGSKSKGFSKKGIPKYRVPMTSVMRERLRHEIFNPLAKIEHHYIVPENRVPLESQGIAELSETNNGPGSQVGQQHTVNSIQKRDAMGRFQDNEMDCFQRGPIDHAQTENTINRGRKEVFGVEKDTNVQNRVAGIPQTKYEQPPSNWQSTNNRRRSESPILDDHRALAKRRKLSYLKSPISICEPMDEDSE